MIHRGIDIICPACRHDLKGYEGLRPHLSCVSCGREYPVLHGIPDLRLWDDPYCSIEQDRAKAEKLAREIRTLDFAGAVEHYYRTTAEVPTFQAERFTRSLLTAEARAAEALPAWEAAAEASAGGDLVEVGCGTAPLLLNAARSYRSVAGVDIALRWLVVAQRRLDDAGVSFPLICGCAEALPFRDGQFDRVVADSTLEHLRSQAEGLQEAHRVLNEGGWLFIATPNRLSPAPDPHTGLPAGGLLPDSITASYMRRKGGIPPRRNLLSARALGRLLEEAGFDWPRIYAPAIPAGQRAALGPAARRIVDIYNAVTHVPFGRALLREVGPLLHAVARKRGSGEQAVAERVRERRAVRLTAPSTLPYPARRATQNTV
jgi:SAM-dependent methyltransferase